MNNCYYCRQSMASNTHHRWCPHNFIHDAGLLREWQDGYDDGRLGEDYNSDYVSDGAYALGFQWGVEDREGG